MTCICGASEYLHDMACPACNRRALGHEDCLRRRIGLAEAIQTHGGQIPEGTNVRAIGRPCDCAAPLERCRLVTQAARAALAPSREPQAPRRGARFVPDEPPDLFSR